MRPLRRLLAAAALASFSVAFPSTEEKTNLHGPGPETVGIMKSDATTEGTFDGTWMYVNRDVHFAMWIRTRGGKEQVRLQYQSLASPEAFETDWDGNAVYYVAGRTATFELKLATADAARMTGSWSWIRQSERAARKESAELVIYRTAYGRSLQMDFNGFTITFTRDGVDRTAKVPTSWSWTKVSKREILWDELPF